MQLHNGIITVTATKSILKYPEIYNQFHCTSSFNDGQVHFLLVAAVDIIIKYAMENNVTVFSLFLPFDGILVRVIHLCYAQKSLISDGKNLFDHLNLKPHTHNG